MSGTGVPRKETFPAAESPGRAKTTAAYDTIADWYQESIASGPFHRLVQPSLLALAAVAPGTRVCDLACGEGRVLRALEESGAVVVGVDISERLLRMAQVQNESRDTSNLVLGDARGALPFRDGSFEIVVCNLALTDIDELDLTVAAVARILRPGGSLVFSVAHPCFKMPYRWADGDQLRPVRSEDYETERFWRAPSEGVRGRVGSIHRPISRYINALARVGLPLVASLEIGDPTSSTPAIPVAWIAKASKIGL